MPQPFIFSAETIHPKIDIDPDAYDAALVFGDRFYPGDAVLSEDFAGALIDGARAMARAEAVDSSLIQDGELESHLIEQAKLQVANDLRFVSGRIMEVA